jgi:hypothetical protein
MFGLARGVGLSLLVLALAGGCDDTVAVGDVGPRDAGADVADAAGVEDVRAADGADVAADQGGVSDGSADRLPVDATADGAEAGSGAFPGCDQLPQPVTTCAPPFNPAVACTFDTGYTFGEDGGLRIRVDRSTLATPAEYGRTRQFRAAGMAAISCSNKVPMCRKAPGLVTTADVVEAFTAPDVVAALAEARPQVYGRDSRPVDGTVLEVLRADGRGFLLGTACTGGQFCTRPLTDGLARVAALLNRLDIQQLAAPGCEALREP